MGLWYCEALLNDVPEEQMCEQAGSMKNHPAWQLGHMVMAADHAAKMLGLDPMMTEEQGKPYGQGSKPTSTASDYGTKDELLGMHRQQHERISAALKEKGADVFGQPMPDANPESMFKKQGDLITFLLAIHEATHLGQLSAWRRAKGYGYVIPGDGG